MTLIYVNNDFDFLFLLHNLFNGRKKTIAPIGKTTILNHIGISSITQYANNVETIRTTIVL